MKLIKTKINGLFIHCGIKFNDPRGFLREVFLEKKIKKKLKFSIVSKSKKNVLRGLHLQLKKTQAKLITVLQGKIFDVCVDCRKKSKTFGKYFSITLSDKENKSLLIPKGFAHGFCSLTSDVVLHYKCSNYRHKDSETGILWNDEDLNIKWPVKNPIVSTKDKHNLKFKDFIRK